MFVYNFLRLSNMLVSSVSNYVSPEIEPEHEVDLIFLDTFLNACDCAYNMSSEEQTS